ncbi:MAG: hypothetical protein UX13_C0003G0002 [Candidatus Woesebacteria bacterium GW2011_GWB1_45_5]|uniref:Uncharacterized protein n=1 Tax=Candidatus Woesebacteria bacterium GW2011_GWB1_45_5 TaxID=1618581 RepID=A0A0G1QQ79_9BACT|nr:MAG: hypothetical protein UX13_C0003G0002 [Candidatus Woesebacteria bacterium GW2011_GWB1_45_5]
MISPKSFAILFSAISLLDWATTAIAFYTLDGFYEMNLISRIALSRGIWGLFLLKVVGVFIVCFGYWFAYRELLSGKSVGFDRKAMEVARLSVVIFGLFITSAVVFSNFYILWVSS